MPAYFDPIAPGLVDVWAGALRAELAWLAAVVVTGFVAIVGLLASAALRARRRAPTRPPLSIRRDPVRPWDEDSRGVIMRYMLLLYTNRAEWEASGEPEAAILRTHSAVIGDLRAAGKFRTSDALEPTSSATTVRVRSGKTLVTDGPFAETKEQLLGYYLVEARDLDDAIAIAARIPDAGVGSVEIRPVREF